MIGRTVSHYRVIAKSGSGGMGVVHEAEDSQLVRKVALEYPPEEMPKDSTSLERSVVTTAAP